MLVFSFSPFSIFSLIFGNLQHTNYLGLEGCMGDLVVIDQAGHLTRFLATAVFSLFFTSYWSTHWFHGHHTLNWWLLLVFKISLDGDLGLFILRQCLSFSDYAFALESIRVDFIRVTVVLELIVLLSWPLLIYMFLFGFSTEAPAFEVLPSLKRLKQRIIAASRGQYDAVFMSGRYGNWKHIWVSFSISACKFNRICAWSIL